MLILPDLIPLLHPFLGGDQHQLDPSFYQPGTRPQPAPGSDQILGLVAGVRWAALVACLSASW